MLPIEMIRLTCSLYGLRLMQGSCKYTLIFGILSKMYYAALVIGMIHSVYLCLYYPSAVEDSILIMILLLVAFGVYVFLRRHMCKIDQVLTGVARLLQDSDRDCIRRTDRWLSVMHLAVVLVSLAGAIANICLTLSTLRSEFKAITGNLSDLSVIAVTLAGFVYYMIVVYGIISCSIQIYTITMVTFASLGQGVTAAVKQALRSGVTLQRVSDIRHQLRTYWHWKGKADSVLSVFPFIWATYLFLSTSLILTKLIAEWRDPSEERSFLLVSLFFSLLLIFSLALKWHLFTSPDKVMDSCLHLAFRLTDIGCNDTQDPLLRQELLCLHLDLANAPATYSTIMGSVPLNFATLISYAGALVNFAVMVINIRTAVKA